MTTHYSLITFQNTDFTNHLAKELSLPVHYARKTVFADGEFKVTVEDPEQFFSRIVYIVHTISNPIHDSFMSLAFLAHELKNSGAARVVAIIPYLGYARQTESTMPGKTGHMAVIAHLLQGAGIDEIVTLEMHTESVRELFTIPVHSISVHDLFASAIKQKIGTQTDVCLVAPDEGARCRVVALAEELGLSYIVFSKERYAADQMRLLSYEGQAVGTCAIIIDDILATGGTAVQACDALYAMNFTTIYGYFVHPVFAGNALEKIRASHFDMLGIGNSIPLCADVSACSFVTQLDLSNFVANALRKKMGWSIKQSILLRNESSV